MQLRWSALALASLAALAASCAGPRGPHLGAAGPASAPAPPLEFEGYPSQANFGIVFVEAFFYTDHEEIFDADLIDDGVLPIALKIGTRGEGMDTDQTRLSPDSMDLHLYLQDGTALSFVTQQRASTLAEDAADPILRDALKPSLLTRWDDAGEGFVFFRIRTGGELEIDGTTVFHEIDGQRRRLDLLHSLLGLTVKTEEGTRDIYVGLRANRRV